MFKRVLRGVRASFRSTASAAATGVLAVTLGLGGSAAWAAADANKAGAEELQTVRGVGPGIAGRILDERKNGPYKDWPDFIARVKGIGEHNAPKFSANGLTINGAGLPGVALAPTGEAKASHRSRARVDRSAMIPVSDPAAATSIKKP